MIVVGVRAGDSTYDVVIGAGVLTRLPDELPLGAKRAAVVTQAGIGVEVDPGIVHDRREIADGEAHKSLVTVEELCRRWSRWGLTRDDVVIAVGGGLVTDVVGFAAAIYHRGVAVVHVPTTLLGMVDAAIGGKTGANLPEGKNLVGAFWQPAAVLCDTDVLVTLPERERRSGLGELAKYHFLTDADPGVADLAGLPLEERIAAAVRIKAAVVAADERESTTNSRGRAVLNYGHTLGHALEIAGAHRLRHGEAVAVGLVYAAELAHRLGRIDADRVAAHRAVLAADDLPTTVPDDITDDDLVTLMARDKKAVSGLTFVLDGPGGVEVVAGVDEADVRAALRAVR